MPKGTTQQQLQQARGQLLLLPQFFRVCEECGKRMPEGHMGVDICHSCMERNHGVVF